MVTCVRTFANLESKPGLSELIKLFYSLVLSEQMLKNRKRLCPAFWRHAGKIGNADYADDIANADALAGHIFAL
jgi:hypothetical protein